VPDNLAAETNVLLLYDIAPDWTPAEKEEIFSAHRRLVEALSTAG
jgi:hypothetical protein